MRQIPAGRWGLVWLCTFAIAFGAVLGLETFVRGKGFVPSIKDDDYAWALERRKVSDGSHHTLAVLGTSRMLLAFSPSGFRVALPGWGYAQLATQGSQPVAALRDLAFDPDFRGVALVDVSENGFDRSNWSSQEDVVSTYRRGWRSIGQLVERALTTEVQSRLALLAGDGLRTLDSLVREGRWPQPRYTTTFADRTKFANYALTDVERRRAVQLARLEGGTEMANVDLWLADALAQELHVALIQARGGEVVYVRMPTCDERWASDEARFPKAMFWDRFARLTRAHTIHFKDHALLAGFTCPDTSHIASKDGATFTRAVIELLRARGVLERRQR